MAIEIVYKTATAAAIAHCRRIALAFGLCVASVGLASCPAFASNEDIVTRGTLTDKSAQSFTVDAVQYFVNGSTSYEDELGNRISYSAFSLNDSVKAKGFFQNGKLIAEELEFEHAQNHEDELEYEGIVTSITGSSLELGTRSIAITNQTRFTDDEKNPISRSLIVAGVKVTVYASTSAPSTAVLIRMRSGHGKDDGDHLSDVPDSVETLGTIFALSATEITVGDALYKITDRTRIEDGYGRSMQLSALREGQIVVAKGFLRNNQRIARKIQLKLRDGDSLNVAGRVTQIGNGTITVHGVTARLTDLTLVIGPQRDELTFAQIEVGMPVRLKVKRLGENDYEAIRIRLRSRAHRGDMDDDGNSDKVVYRHDLGLWFINYGDDRDANGQRDSETLAWGLPNDQPFLVDVDGDKRSDLTVFRPSNGTWYVRLSDSGYELARSVQWGAPGDIPTPGDYDCDGVTDFAVFRPASGIWYALLSSGGDRAQALQGNSAHVLVRQWGLSHHIPIGGHDRDGDCRDDLIVWDSASGVWYTLYSSSGYNRDAALAGDLGAGDARQFGLPGDHPLIADFDGDGRDDLVAWRNGVNYVLFSSGVHVPAFQFGLFGDIPSVLEPGDDSRERRAGLSVYRPSTGEHFERHPSGELSVTQWGLPGSDIPVSNHP